MANVRQMVAEAVGEAFRPQPPAQASVSRVVPPPQCSPRPVQLAVDEFPGTLPPLPQRIMDAISRGEYVSFDIIYSALLDGPAGSGGLPPVTLALASPPGADATIQLTS